MQRIDGAQHAVLRYRGYGPEFQIRGLQTRRPRHAHRSRHPPIPGRDPTNLQSARAIARETMSLRTFCADLRFRFAGLVTDRWYDVRVYWYTANKGPWVLAAAVGLIVATLGFVLRAMSADEEDRRNLTCLAQNVYFEARGEPQAGQVAVAEVTMNRKASGRYPDTVCGVVYQKNWDPLRRRHVGAFSWTEFDSVETPTGEPWQQAWKVAESVYYRRETPVVAGALFYHATYIKPSWARGKQPIAQIGRHVFYR